MTRTKLILILIIFIFSLFGCEPKFVPVQTFQMVSNIPEGKAVIYFYRPTEEEGTDLRYPIYRIKKDGKPVLIAVLYNGGYYPYLTKAGYVRVYAKSAIRRYRDAFPSQSIDFTIKPGEARYIRTYNGGVAMSLGMPKSLAEMRPEVGKREISACALIPEELMPRPPSSSIPEDWR